MADGVARRRREPGRLTWQTLPFGIANVTLLAHTVHRAQRERVLDRTDRPLGAWFRLQARVLADATEASQLARTIRIHRTLRRIGYRNCRERKSQSSVRVTLTTLRETMLLTLLARQLRITGIAWRAAAARPMVIDPALGVRCAVARIPALLVLARLMVRTLVIARTLWPVATDERITPVAIGTVAASVVIVIRPAVRIRTALRVLARIDTVPVHAGFRRRTVTVGTATDLVASELRIPGVAFPARTDRTVELYPAFGVLRAQARPNGAGILALPIDARLIVRTLAIARTLRLRCVLGRLLVALDHTLHER